MKLYSLSDSKVREMLEKCEIQQSHITDSLIPAGRGSEKYNETLKKTDPLSVNFRILHDKWSELRNEMESRSVYGAKWWRAKCAREDIK